jgi:hypothetical protein
VLAVPAGCEVLQSNQGGGRIRCPGGNGEVQWRIAPYAPAIETWVEGTINAYLAEFDGVTDAGPELIAETFRCSLDGVEADCTTLNVYPSLWIDIAWAVVRGRPAGVMCIHEGLDPTPPPVCNVSVL